jgi:ribonuclease P protein component
MQGGKVFYDDFFISKCISSNDNISHFAVSIPKKVAKTAVSRNKIRRRIYSIIRKLKNSLISHKNLVLIAKNGIDKISFIKLTEEVEKIFVKYGLLK